jgi:hypothetical protein
VKVALRRRIAIVFATHDFTFCGVELPNLFLP